MAEILLLPLLSAHLTAQQKLEMTGQEILNPNSNQQFQ